MLTQCFNQDRVHVVMLKPRVNILQNPLRLQSVVESLQFCVRPVVIGMIIDKVTRFKYEGMDVLFAFVLGCGCRSDYRVYRITVSDC